MDFDDFGGIPMGGNFGFPGGHAGFAGDSFGNAFNSSGLGRKPQGATERELRVTLEELYYGTTKKEKIKSWEKEIIIKPGWKTGTKLTYHGEGDNGGDLIIKIVQIPHNFYIREGNDLVYQATITLSQALTGVRLTLPDLTKKTHDITIKEVIHPTYETRIKGAGMPKVKDPNTFGDMIVRYTTKFPTHIRDTDRAKLKEILSQF